VPAREAGRAPGPPLLYIPVAAEVAYNWSDKYVISAILTLMPPNPIPKNFKHLPAPVGRRACLHFHDWLSP